MAGRFGTTWQNIQRLEGNYKRYWGMSVPHVTYKKINFYIKRKINYGNEL